MTRFEVSLVDVLVLRGTGAAIECLALRRAAGGRCPGSWETVHGHIEYGERPAEAALREVREECGLAPARLYNLSRVETFYMHRTDSLAFVAVFVAFVPPEAEVRTGGEHDAHDHPREEIFRDDRPERREVNSNLAPAIFTERLD